MKYLDNTLQLLLTAREKASTSHMSIDKIDEDIDSTRREISRLKQNTAGGWFY
jgi:hypothetical protein